METVSVTSTNLSEIAYDSDKQELFIIFHNGKKYRYDAVPAEVWESFKVAESKGSFFSSSIKGKYAFIAV